MNLQSGALTREEMTVDSNTGLPTERLQLSNVSVDLNDYGIFIGFSLMKQINLLLLKKLTMTETSRFIMRLINRTF